MQRLGDPGKLLPLQASQCYKHFVLILDLVVGIGGDTGAIFISQNWLYSHFFIKNNILFSFFCTFVAVILTKLSFQVRKYGLE